MRVGVQVLRFRCVIVTALMLSLAVSLSPSVAAFQEGPTDPDEVAEFVDAMFAEQMEEHHIPGAVFIMVKDGDIFLSRGYGYADLASETPVDPERTLFEVGSVTKLFTATAVMQQVEQGAVDLDTDVNTYLTEVQVPDTYAEPVTLAHLLTHTAGFDERFYIGMVAPSADAVEPLADNLARHLPPRIRPPGQTHQYSNAGSTLASHVVEAVSGESFDEYIMRHILEPLGMDCPTFDVSPDMAADMAVGHENIPDQATPQEHWYISQRPAGGLRTTGTDIAAFMLAHLNGGEHGDGRILQAETVEEMHQTRFSPHAGVAGMAHGFFVHDAGGQRALQHGGQWIGFSSLLYLLPEADVGIFVSYNHGSGVLAQYELIEALLDRYYPVPEFAGESAVDGGAGSSASAGTYRFNRQDHHTFLQLPSMLLNPTLEVRVEANGQLTTKMSPTPLLPDTQWVQSEPGVFHEVGGTNNLAFDVAENRKVNHLHVGWPLLLTMDRIGWFESRAFHLGLLGLFMLTFMSAVVGWPVGRLYRRLRRRRAALPSTMRLARLLGGLVSGLGVAFVVGLLLFALIDPIHLFQVPTGLKALLWLPLIGTALTVPLVVVVSRLWVRGEGTLVGRAHVSLVALALIGYIPYLYYWGLLGFNY